MAKLFQLYLQRDAVDCGPTCLKMVFKHYGKNFSLQNLREKCYITREGVSILGLSDAAESLGFRTIATKITYTQLNKNAPKPCIVFWNNNHFVVVYRITNKYVWVADPANKKTKFTKQEFLDRWGTIKTQLDQFGVALLLEPTPDFFTEEGDNIDKSKLSFLLKYLIVHQKFAFQLLISILVGSLLQLLFPFLTQAIVDIGINSGNKNFLLLVMIAQIFLVISRLSINFIRSWILLHISTRMNVSIISDFLTKLMKLPASFF